MNKYQSLVIFLGFITGAWFSVRAGDEVRWSPRPEIRNAGFVCLDGVYNSELMAPYDILQHTIYRDSTNYIRCFIVTPDGQPFTTSEGIRMIPHYSFDTVPPIDILVIPSTENSMSKDLQNAAYMSWLKTAVENAAYVMSLCDGAFPLAATGHLDGRHATTFPADRPRLRAMFPRVTVHEDAHFVVDGKYITAVGGALSYEPALYLLEKIYSVENARRTAQGMVLDWELSSVPHFIVPDSARSGDRDDE